MKEKEREIERERKRERQSGTKTETEKEIEREKEYTEGDRQKDNNITEIHEYEKKRLGKQRVIEKVERNRERKLIREKVERQVHP